MNEEHSLYRIWFESTGTVYVGITKNGAQARINKHLAQLREGNHCNELLQSEYNNNWRYVKYELLEKFINYRDAAKKEQDLMIFYADKSLNIHSNRYLTCIKYEVTESEKLYIEANYGTLTCAIRLLTKGGKYEEQAEQIELLTAKLKEIQG